jgi:putative ABC transport system substrate-binding protein
MAARVLKGESAQSIPFETISEYGLYINTAALDNLGIAVPDTLKDKAQEVSEDN